ncbi:unnamed protein product [Phytophthora lilii]|uniref:Unnamed protein product n=1 Tax=Phytophthora lilii TaxID=2077276 RepID=A0A9W6YLA1_9STRA|nr:unnamed protein product [Phytophthora lilii]
MYKEDPLPKLHDESEASFKKYVEAQNIKHPPHATLTPWQPTKAVYDIKSKRYNEASVADVDDFSDRQTDRSVKQTMNSMLNTVSGRRLKGRGHRGAGVAPLEGVVRRERTYNLNEIQGLATPSAYVYRQLRSKYIRLLILKTKS